MTHKILKFIKALWWHVNAGMPKADKQQILERYNICLDCEYMDKKKSQCLQCGCNLSTKKIFMNKLAWADQECPIMKWNKINVTKSKRR